MLNPQTTKHDPSTWRDADAVYDGKAFGMRTKSGAGNSGVDDRGATYFLAPNVSNRALGAALRDTLEQTRLILDDAEFRAFFSKEEVARNKQSWINAQVANMGERSFPVLRKKLVGIGVSVTNDLIYLKPTDNRNGRQWLYLPDRDVKDIKLPYDSDDAVIGAALREAFKRCEGTGRADMTFDDPLPD